MTLRKHVITDVERTQSSLVVAQSKPFTYRDCLDNPQQDSTSTDASGPLPKITLLVFTPKIANHISFFYKITIFDTSKVTHIPRNFRVETLLLNQSAGATGFLKLFVITARCIHQYHPVCIKVKPCRRLRPGRTRTFFEVQLRSPSLIVYKISYIRTSYLTLCIVSSYRISTGCSLIILVPAPLW